jgi:glutamine---fructose-6-phosphate transaminase (isomerizing)
MTTRLLQDILNQPAELIRSLQHNIGPGLGELERAAAMLRQAEQVFITGIGSSWHAGMAVQSFLHAAGRCACLIDASELLHHVKLPPGAALIVLSRSGKSIEIVKLLDKAAAAQAAVVGVTNTPDSPLAQRAAVTLRLEAEFDHCVSVTMYSGLALVGSLASSAAAGESPDALERPLRQMIESAAQRLPHWQSRIEESGWLDGDAAHYFLARGASAASAYETRLLWEEAAKAPAGAMTTGGFRHGPQEMVSPGTRIGIWIDNRILSSEDLALAGDLRNLGCRVMLIGQDLPDDAADLVLSLPRLPEAAGRWQFLVDIMPGQLAAEALARHRGVDCDTFRICPYIIEAEGGLAVQPP